MRVLIWIGAAAAMVGAQTIEERIGEAVKAMEPRLVECRRDLHMHPELSNREERTGKLVAERLRALGLDEVRAGVAGHGVVGVLKGRQPGGVVAWRADMDALPIDESKLNVPYKSTVKGVKHACGHDAHTAIGLGIAEALVKVKEELPGTVKFLFQPAEEGAGGAASWGAKQMIAEGALENPRPGAIFALHVGTHIPVGQMSTTDNAASAASGAVAIEFQGKKAHGAYPYQGIDAVAVASQCIVALQTIHSRRLSSQEPSVFSLGTIHGGDRRNVIAESVKVTGTVRTFSDKVLDQYEAMIHQTLKGCTGGMGAGYRLEFKRSYPAMMNSPSLNEGARPVLERLLGKGNLVTVGPGMFAEDFSYYQRQVPGVMLGLGVANAAKGLTAGLHTAEFDLDEDALAIGVKAGAHVVVDYLRRSGQ
ncbi:MAG: M20 family metallopeptidase [Acidobacteriota bacterium]